VQDLLRGRLAAAIGCVDKDPDAAEVGLWEVRRLLAALRPQLGDEAAKLGKTLDQLEVRIATIRVTQITLELSHRRRALQKHVGAGEIEAAGELLMRMRRELDEAGPILGLTSRGRMALRELSAALDETEARILSGDAPASKTLGLTMARVKVLSEALIERLNRGALAEASKLAEELSDETARLREVLPFAPAVLNADAVLTRAERETREHRELCAVERLVEEATGSVTWLVFAIEKRRVVDAMQARDNLVEAVAPLRARHADHLEGRAFLDAVDALFGRLDRELGAEIARAEADACIPRARMLLGALERGAPARTMLDLEEVAAYLLARKQRAPEIGPWIRRVEAAIERERRRRRSPTSMIIGVLNDVVFGATSLTPRGASV